MATTITDGTKTIAATAAALASAQEVAWLSIYSPQSNAEVWVGDSAIAAAGGRPLMPGKDMLLLQCDLADVYVIGTAGNVIYFIAGYGTSTSGLTVIQPTAASLTATVTPVGWSISGEKGVATTAIKASAGTLHGFLVETDGTNSVTVQFYNHASTATNQITPSIVVAGGDNYGGVMGMDATCSNGIVLVLSGTNGVATVFYS